MKEDCGAGCTTLQMVLNESQEIDFNCMMMIQVGGQSSRHFKFDLIWSWKSYLLPTTHSLYIEHHFQIYATLKPKSLLRKVRYRQVCVCSVYWYCMQKTVVRGNRTLQPNDIQTCKTKKPWVGLLLFFWQTQTSAML